MKNKIKDLINKLESKARFLMKAPGYYNQARLEVIEEITEELESIAYSEPIIISLDFDSENNDFEPVNNIVTNDYQISICKGVINLANLSYDDICFEIRNINDILIMQDVTSGKSISLHTTQFEINYKYVKVIKENKTITILFLKELESPKTRTDRLKEHVADTADCEYIGYASLD